MAGSSTTKNPISTDPRAAAVESSDFPILCETCLGPNPYVRMLRDKWGRPCKVCERPFTVFRWKPAGDGMRYKNTEICQTCARMKNVCQTCLLDLVYGLPVQVRDAGMAAADRQAVTKPTSDAARQYVASQGERALATGKVDAVYAAPMVNSVAEKAKRATPRYERNRAQLCSWFAKGKCARGLYCQFRHELPKDKSHPFSKQNIQDRYYGVNDPVAASILARTATADGSKRKERHGRALAGEDKAPEPPEDQSITSLFIGGVTATVNEQVLRALFKERGQEITSVRVVSAKSIAFVDFATREAAEDAIAARHGRVEIADAKLSIGWARGANTASHGKRMARAMTPTVGPGDPGPRVPDISGMVPFVQPPPQHTNAGRAQGLGTSGSDAVANSSSASPSEGPGSVAILKPSDVACGEGASEPAENPSSVDAENARKRLKLAHSDDTT